MRSHFSKHFELGRALLVFPGCLIVPFAAGQLFGNEAALVTLVAYAGVLGLFLTMVIRQQHT